MKTEIGPQDSVSFTKLDLTSAGGKVVDLTRVVVETSIFEDLLSNGMSGFLLLRESYNLPETVPIIGEETLRVSFTTYIKNKTKKTVFDKTFRVTKIENYVFDQQNNIASYILHFVSEMFYQNQHTRLNRAFGSEKHPQLSSDIVSNVCKNMFGLSAKQMIIEPTKFDRNVICSNWTPFQLFNHLAESDIADNSSLEFKESTMVFFEDRDGANFLSWSSIIEGKHLPPTIKSLNFNQTTTNSTSKKEVSADQVYDFKIEQVTDELENIMSGAYSNRFIYHDVINKTVETVNFNYSDQFNNISHVDGKAKSFDLRIKQKNTPADSTSLLPKEYHFANDLKTSYPWRQIHKSRISRLKNFRITVTVTGESSHRIGSVISCDIPSTRKKGNGEHDKYIQMSGNYVISKIRHVISSTVKYQQVLELTKGSQRKI